MRVPGKAARQGAGREWWRSDVWARDEWRPRVLFLKAILSSPGVGDFTGGSHAGWV